MTLAVEFVRSGERHKLKMSLEEWRSSISENERRERLRQRIQQGEGARYLREYASSMVPHAITQLREFMASAEIAFMRQELAKHPYDLAALNSSYSIVFSTQKERHAEQIKWPASVFYLQEGDFTEAWRSAITNAPKSAPLVFHAMTERGLTQFRHGYSLWSGYVLRVSPITPDEFLQFRVTYILGANVTRVWWSELFNHYDVRYSWEDWAKAVRQAVESYLDVQSVRSQIEARFSALTQVRHE